MLIALWNTVQLAIVGLEDLDPPRAQDVAGLKNTLSGMAPLPETGEGECTLYLPDGATLTSPAVTFSPTDAVEFLTALPQPFRPEWGDSIRFWQTLARICRQALESRQFYPTLRRNEGGYTALWQPLVGGKLDVEKLERFAQAIPPVCRATQELSTIHPLRLVESFLTEATDGLLRRVVRRDDWFLNRVSQRPAEADVRWLHALLADSRVVETDGDEISPLYDAAHGWLAPITDHGDNAEQKLGFVLKEPAEEDQPWPVEFRLFGDDDTDGIPATELWQQQAGPLTALGRTIAERQQKLIAELRRAMEAFPSLERILTDEQPAGIQLSSVEAFAFMRSWGPALEDAGFSVEVPDWAGPEQSLLSLRLALTPEDDEDPFDASGPNISRNGQPLTAGGRVGLESLVRFDWRIAVGQRELTPAEFEQLLARQSPLVKFNGQWVQVDLEAAAKAKEAIDQNSTGKLTLGEAFRVAYGLAGDAGVPVAGLTGADWVGKLLDQAPDVRIADQTQPVDFKGELRPYQLRGLQWMSYLDRLGLGACLADDMGLGKTIQLIALLLKEREIAAGMTNGDGQPHKVGPTLLFAPASVVGNWTREFERFAPQMKLLAHHGPLRLHGDAFVETVNNHDVVITGYALAHRDMEDLKRIQWRRIVLDEAQKVKNPSSAASTAIRGLSAARRVALTGTPIENHLSELWAIMEVLNPGLLGSPSQFRERFVIPVEKMGDPKRGQLLRDMIRPFLLRRTKQDPEVAVNLPSKMEMRVFTSLTPEQAAMYERITADMLTSVENASGIRRRGLILAGLTRLKQVCDHPALLTPDEQKIEGRSGKCERLVDMLEEVIAADDAALIFTQYREMGHLLEKLIHSRLGEEPLFLHGGVPVKDRDTMIQEFQTPGTKKRIFILSLRAGGLGLNLTAANHVFHFDRWWNPAVEAQATDRAHRIGQQKIVQVHKFVSIGTVEERIDKLLADKTQLAENIVTSGDQWLTNLSTEDLKKYLALSSEAIEE